MKVVEKKCSECDEKEKCRLIWAGCFERVGCIINIESDEATS